MSKQIDDKKRTYAQMQEHVEVPVGELSNRYKSKSDFVLYMS